MGCVGQGIDGNRIIVGEPHPDRRLQLSPGRVQLGDLYRVHGRCRARSEQTRDNPDCQVGREEGQHRGDEHAPRVSMYAPTNAARRELGDQPHD